jgi:hypothetical protein
MVGIFRPVARLERSGTGRSFKFYLLTESGTVFVGLLSRRDFLCLLHGETTFANICKYVDNPKRLPIKVADPTKLEPKTKDKEVKSIDHPIQRSQNYS